MIRHLWSVICAKTITDSETHLVSLFDVIEGVSVVLKKPLSIEEKTLVQMKFDLVSAWYKEGEDGVNSAQCFLVLVGPTGEELAKSEFSVDCSERNRARTVAHIEGLPIGGQGVHWMIVKVSVGSNGEQTEIARLPIEVSITVKCDESSKQDAAQ
jgi:hypothetical protein